MTTFEFNQQVPIEFGIGALDKLPQIITRLQGTKGLIISTKSMIQNGMVAKIKEQNPTLQEVFYDIQPNPTIQNTQDCVDLLREEQYDFAIALGGGSVLDAAKVAAVLAPTTASVQTYFDG